MTLDPRELARYQRHLSLDGVGRSGQEKLRAASVLIVGVGGLGSPAALYLAAAGVGRLGLIDGDRIDLSNLQRQVLFDTASVGEPKAQVAAERLRKLNPHVEVRSYTHDLEPANALSLIGAYDVVVDGSDRLATRYLVNDACVIARKPLVSAAIHQFEGQAMTYVPDQGPCYRCLFAAADEGSVPNCAAAGVLGVLPGVMGSLQATEALKLIVGVGRVLTGRLLIYDALEMQFSEFAFARRADCAVCGDVPSITALSLASAVPPRWAPRELQQRIEFASARPGTLVLIDVREPQEYAIAHLPGSINIPLGQLALRLAEVPAAESVVFVCRSGGRSQAASRRAAAAGHSGAVDLNGGLLAWADVIDPGFTVAPAPG